MDFSQLKTFVAVAHHGHLTQAAETLHLSQPAVTAKIKSLEKALELELFARNAQGMQLTLLGQAFLPQAEKLLQEVHRVNAFALELAKEDKLPIHLGITSAVTLPILSQAIQKLCHELPHVYVEIIEDIGGNILNQVRKKELLAGIYIGEVPYRNVLALPLQKQQYCVICPKTWQNDLHDAANLKQKPWLIMSAFTSGSKATQTLWQQLHMRPNVILQCDHLDTLIHLVATNMGLALVPRCSALSALEQGAQITILENYCIHEPVQMIYHMELELDPVLQSLKQIMQNLV